MKLKISYLWLSIVAIIVCALCILLPSYLLKRKDSAILRQITTESMTSHTLDNRLSILEKIELYRSADVNTTNLTQGKIYTEETVIEVFAQEIEQIKEMGLIPPEDYDIKTEEVYVNYCISMDDPSSSFISWDIFFKTKTYDGYFTLEEESGRIIAFSLAFPYNNTYSLDTQEGANIWAEYLGVQLERSTSSEFYEYEEHGATMSSYIREYYIYSQDDAYVVYYLFLQDGQYLISPS